MATVGRNKRLISFAGWVLLAVLTVLIAARCIDEGGIAAGQAVDSKLREPAASAASVEVLWAEPTPATTHDSVTLGDRAKHEPSATETPGARAR